MARKNVHYYLIKAARISGWLLVPLMLVFIITGFAIRGDFGLNRLIEPNAAKLVHRDYHWPVVIVFLVHTSITSYFALRRWGWIKTRTNK